MRDKSWLHLSAGPTANSSDVVLVTSDRRIIGETLDSIRRRLLPDEDEERVEPRLVADAGGER